VSSTQKIKYSPRRSYNDVCFLKELNLVVEACSSVNRDCPQVFVFGVFLELLGGLFCEFSGWREDEALDAVS